MKNIRGVKIVFASYAASVGVVILSILLGLIIFGADDMNYAIDKFMLPATFVVTLILIPVMSKKLK